MSHEPTQEHIENAKKLYLSTGLGQEYLQDLEDEIKSAARFLAARDARLNAEYQARIKELEAMVREQSDRIIEMGAKLNATKLREEGAEERLAQVEKELSDERWRHNENLSALGDHILFREDAESKLASLSSENAALKERVAGLVVALVRAKKVIGTLYFAAKREGWEKGPSLNEGLSAAQDFTSQFHENIDDTDERILWNWHLGNHSSAVAKHTEESNG